MKVKKKDCFKMYLTKAIIRKNMVTYLQGIGTGNLIR